MSSQAHRAASTSGQALRAGFRTDFDVARVYRLTAAATAFGGLGGMFVRGRGLAPWQRRLCRLSGAGYAAVGLFGLWISPAHVALWFQRRPRRTLAASLGPLLLSGLTGGPRSPLYRLVTVGVAAGAGVRGERRSAQTQCALASLLWYAGAAMQPEPAEQPMRTYFEIPVGFMALAGLATTASQVAYDSRNLFDQLFEFAYEREDLESYVVRLTTALEKMRVALTLAASAEPAPGVTTELLRDQALASLGRLEERLGVLWVASLSKFDLQQLVTAASRGWRTQIAADRRAIVLGAPELEQMLRSRAVSFSRLGVVPPVDVQVAPSVTVTGLRELALLGAGVTAGIANVARHATGATSVHVALADSGGQLTLSVTDDGPATIAPILDEQRNTSGLTHLRRQARRRGGNVTLERAGPHGLRLKMTLRGTETTEHFEFWASEIRGSISRSLDEAVLLTAVKSAAGVALGELDAIGDGASSARARRTAALQLALAGAAQLASSRQTSRTHPGFHALVLAAALPLTREAALHRRPPASSWLNAFAARFAFELPRARRLAYALAGLNALALVSGTLGRPPARRSASLAREVVSMTFGPALMAATINAAQPRVQALEHAINERLAEVESLHELADSFHADHPAAPKILDLAPMVADAQLGDRLRAKLSEIESAEETRLERVESHREAVQLEDPLARLGAVLARRAPRLAASRPARALWPERLSYHNPTSGLTAAERLSGYLASALGRRIWPATVHVSLDPRTLIYLPAAALTSAPFRREATATMDILGRELNRTFARRWNGDWPLSTVELRVSVLSQTGSIVCELFFWTTAPGRWARGIAGVAGRVGRVPFVGGPEDAVADLRELLGKVGASLSQWTILPGVDSEAPEFVSPTDHGRRVRMVRRGFARVELHPQRYATDG